MLLVVLVKLGDLSIGGKAGKGEDVTPIREYLEGGGFPDTVKEFSQGLTDDKLRSKLLTCISWDCGQPGFTEIRDELLSTLVEMGQDQFEFLPYKAPFIADLLCTHILRQSVE